MLALFYIDLGLARPFLVVNHAQDGTVSGVVFIDPEADGNTRWCRDLFYSPQATGKHDYWIAGVKRGTAVGEWEPQIVQPPWPEQATIPLPPPPTKLRTLKPIPGGKH